MLKTLYNTRAGGYVLKMLIRPGFSRTGAKVMDSRYSKLIIKRFIRRNGIDMNEYLPERYKSFNAFFTRRIKPEARPVDMDAAALISPADSALSAYTITPGCELTIKGTQYTVEQLLENAELAEKYRGGMCIIFRLMPVNYHRYIYPDNGTKDGNTFIQGQLHTVRPVALERVKVFATNSREYTTLHTENFGDVIFMEVGALLVGRICNHHQEHSFARGDEKGYFEYGGSTIIMLLEKNKAQLDENFASIIDTGLELPVQVGQRIGARIDA